MRHPNIITLRAYYWSIDEKLLIYDYIPNGNLSVAIHGRSGMRSSARLKISKGIAKGLAFLHEFSPKEYFHGDLKPSNVLLGLNMEAHISYPFLQSARMAVEETQNQQPDFAFSPITSQGSCYQAPEALKTLKALN